MQRLHGRSRPRHRLGDPREGINRQFGPNDLRPPGAEVPVRGGENVRVVLDGAEERGFDVGHEITL